MNRTKRTSIEKTIVELERHLAECQRDYPEQIKGPNPPLKRDEAQHRINCLFDAIERLKRLKADIEQDSITQLLL